MSIFRAPFTFKAIRRVSDVKGIYGTLYSLERKMLIEKVNGKYFIPEVVRSICYKLIDNPKELHWQAAQYYLSEGSTESIAEATYHIIKADAFRGIVETLHNDFQLSEFNNNNEERNCNTFPPNNSFQVNHG